MAAGLHITASSYIKNGTVYKNKKLVFEQPGLAVNDFLSALYKNSGVNYPKFYKMDNLSKLGFLATEVLLQEFDKAGYPPEKVGVILSNANSSLDADLKYWKSVQDIPSPALFVYTLPNIVIGEICIRNGFKGEHAFYVTPQFDTGFIYRQVKYLFDAGLVQTAICGWVDVLKDDYEAALFLIENKNEGVVFEAVRMEFETNEKDFSNHNTELLNY